MEGAVPGALAIGLRGSAGLTEVFDQILALGELLFLKAEHGTDALQREGQSHRGRPDHGAAPALRVEVTGAFFRERMIVLKGIEA